MKYQSVMDLHTHTVASGHAYCTLREMAKAASDKGLELLGITEHAPKMPGTCHKFYFQNIKVVPREMYGIQLLLGSEVNILDAAGTVDLAQKTLEKLDVVIASLHVPCIKPGSRQENTEAYLNVMKNPYVNIIGHPDDGRYDIDYEALVQGAKEYGKVLELNNHSMDPDCTRENAVENDTIMLNYCKKYQVPVVMDSDAHFDLLIGEFDLARALLTKLSGRSGTEPFRGCREKICKPYILTGGTECTGFSLKRYRRYRKIEKILKEYLILQNAEKTYPDSFGIFLCKNQILSPCTTTN